MIEIKAVSEFPGYYICSNGRIFNQRGFLNPYKNGAGYLTIDTRKDDVRTCPVIHRLVAKAFIPNPHRKPEVNHINGDKTDNRVENLEWVTHSENIRHAFRTGLECNKGEQHPSHKLTSIDVQEIRKLLSSGKFTHREIASMFNVSRYAITDINRGRSWNDL